MNSLTHWDKAEIATHTEINWCMYHAWESKAHLYSVMMRLPSGRTACIGIDDIERLVEFGSKGVTILAFRRHR